MFKYSILPVLYEYFVYEYKSNQIYFEIFEIPIFNTVSLNYYISKNTLNCQLLIEFLYRVMLLNTYYIFIKYVDNTKVNK